MYAAAASHRWRLKSLAGRQAQKVRIRQRPVACLAAGAENPRFGRVAGPRHYASASPPGSS